MDKEKHSKYLSCFRVKMKQNETMQTAELLYLTKQGNKQPNSQQCTDKPSNVMLYTAP